MEKSDFFLFGRITKTHGYKGNVILSLDLAENFEYYQKNKALYLELENKLIPFFLVKLSVHNPNQLCLSFEDIESEQQASSIIHSNVYLPNDILPPIDEDNFYNKELIGFSIEDENSDFKGVVIDLKENSFQSLLEIRSGEKIVLVPIVDEFIVDLMQDEKKIILSLPEGLLEI